MSSPDMNQLHLPQRAGHKLEEGQWLASCRALSTVLDAKVGTIVAPWRKTVHDRRRHDGARLGLGYMERMCAERDVDGWRSAGGKMEVVRAKEACRTVREKGSGIAEAVPRAYRG